MKVGGYIEVEMSEHDTTTTIYDDLPIYEFLTGYLYRDASMFEKPVPKRSSSKDKTSSATFIRTATNQATILPCGSIRPQAYTTK